MWWGDLNYLLFPSEFSFKSSLTPINGFFEENLTFEKTKQHKFILFQEPWNPSGTNLLNENWPFPIFMVDNEETVNFLQKCFNDFNKPDPDTNASRDWPLCAIELQVTIREIYNYD